MNAGFSDDDIIKSLRDASEHITMTKKEYEQYAKENHLPSLSTVCRKMSGWTEALEAAGLEPVRVRRRRPRSVVEDAFAMEIRKVKVFEGLNHCQDDIQPTILSKREYSEWRRRNPEYPGVSTIISLFGSWREALRFSNIPNHTALTDDEGVIKYDRSDILDALMYAHEAGVVSSKDYAEWRRGLESSDMPSLSTVITHLGSWSAAKRFMASHERKPEDGNCDLSGV